MHRSLCLLLIAVLFFLPLQVNAQEQDPFDTVLKEQMSNLLSAYSVPGIILSRIQNGEVAWTEAYGFANTRTDDPMQPEMIMNFGSCGKVLTAWGVMRLVEAGKIDLDAPANLYLKRWKIESGEFDSNEVTVRRLLSHTGGLTVHGFSDYSKGRKTPSLTQMLEGQNQMDGSVLLSWQPGTRFSYSGGGFVLLQMIIEDVTGQSFEDFMQAEVAGPLGLESLRWAWTPEHEAMAAMPHGTQGEPVGYRQLASAAIGSEISTTTDFARFVAAVVEGPNGEPAGRGVLSPETILEMTTPQSATDGGSGLSYGTAVIGGDRVLMHFGSNLGWNAFFTIDVDTREGLVAATNSANGFEMLTAVQNLWVENVLGASVTVYPPVSDTLGMQGRVAWIITLVFAVPMAAVALVFFIQLTTGRRKAGKNPGSRLLGVLPWALLALFWWYWFYAPSRSLLPYNFPDVWPLPQAAYVMVVLLAWVLLSLGLAFLPKDGKRGERQSFK